MSNGLIPPAVTGRCQLQCPKPRPTLKVETSFFLVTAFVPTKKRELRGNTVPSDAVEQVHLSRGGICKVQKMYKKMVCNWQ